MNKYFISLCFLAVAAAHVIPHIPSGSVAVSKNGAVVAGPAGSIHTNNGLYGHGAGVQLSGPAGDVHTHGGHATLSGPGYQGDDGHWKGDWNGSEDDGDDGEWHGDAWSQGDDGEWHGEGWNNGEEWNHGNDGQWYGDAQGDDGQWHGEAHGAVAIVAPVASWGSHGHHGW